MNKGVLIVLSGPSGVGKGTVVARLRELLPELAFSVSATTRAPRPGEEHGKHYFFLSPEEFAAMKARGELLESAGFGGNSYGTPRGAVEAQLAAGTDVLLEIEVQGAFQVMEAMPDALTVFLLPPGLQELERRLRGRATETEEAILRRLSIARGELPQAERFETLVRNDDAAACASRLLHLIEAKKAGAAPAQSQQEKKQLIEEVLNS